MKTLIVLLTLTTLQVTAEGYGQTITLSKKNATLKEIFKEVQKQSPYTFAYTDNTLANTRRVDINVKNAEIGQVLSICFSGQPVEYEMEDKVIIVKAKKQEILHAAPADPGDGVVSVKGKITDEDGKPIVRASVNVKGSSKLVLTDDQGEFALDMIEGKSVLVVSCVGYESQHLSVNGKNNITTRLKVAVNSMDETVVVAYGTTSQRTNTASVTVVKAEQIQDLPVRSVDKALQGLVPGLLVTSGTGQPGGGVSNFVLRGVSTGQDPFNDFSTVRNPLIVIDGVPVTQDNYQWNAGDGMTTPVINPMAQLNPSDIESITVLKDAAAIALYGSKASNGVILLTTKKGKAGKTVIGLRNQVDMSKRLKGKIELINQQEYLELVSETLKNYNSTIFPNDSSVTAFLKKQFPIRSDGSFYPFTNWEDELYTKLATTISNNLSFSGGNDRSNFYLDLGYAKQNGVVKRTGYDQKAIRFNFENRPVNWLKWGLNMGLSYNRQDYGAGLSISPVSSEISSPLNPVRLEDGSYFLNFTYPFQSANPVAANEYNTNKNTSFRGLNKLFSEISFLKYFKFTTNLGIDFMLLEAKEKVDSRLYDATASIGSGKIRERNTRNLNLITTNIFRFDKLINKYHSVNLLLGQEAQVLNTKYLEATGTNILIPGFDQIAGTGKTTSTGAENKRTLLSFFGQTNYGYKNRYFFSSSVRADGSSNFGERNKFGTFWSTGLGWIATEEKFMKGAASWLPYLKLRGSVGAAGNSFAIDRNTRYDRLVIGNYLNSLAVYPNTGSGPGNPDIQWEQTFTWDAGLEARFLQGRISITADVYKKKTSNVVSSITLPLVTGYYTVKDNIGDIENKGIELSLSADIIKTKDFRWNLNANWSTNQNVLIKTSKPTVQVGSSYLYNLVGKSMNSFYLVRWAGVNPADGASMWIDSAGKPNTNYNAAKPEYAGKPQPDGFGTVTNTFSYKNIQLSALFYYQYGYQIYDIPTSTNDGYNAFQNQDKRALDRWRKNGDITSNPKRVLNNSTAQLASTRFLSDGDYIRLQTLTIGYTFPSKVLSRLGVGMLKLYAQAYNLAIWTKYPTGDPANISPAGNASFTYPNAQSYSFGINLNF